MRKIIGTLFSLCFIFSMVSSVDAQVFASPNTKRQKEIVKPAWASSSSKSSVEAKKTSQDKESTAKTSKSYVVKDFSDSKQDEKEYDNSDGKIFKFKVVNGELVIDDSPRSILVYYENYQLHRSLDGITRCSLRMIVLNDLETRVSDLSFKLHWPEISTVVQMNRMNPGVRTYKDIMLLGKGCMNIDAIPTIEVNRCRVKGMSQNECADRVRWHQLPKKTN